ncbi:MAG: adenylate/guanylate cyclase domain-containing protein [bacterium]
MSERNQAKHDLNHAERKPGVVPGKPSPSLSKKSEHKFQHLISSLWQKSVEIFKFLPIRFKLSLIIGTIVVFVVTTFGLIVLHSQKVALMNSVTQVCNALIQGLSENVKGDLLLGEYDKVIEAVHRFKKTQIEGLEQVAVLNHKAKLIAQFDKEGKEIRFVNQADLLKLRNLSIVEKPYQFEYYYPIMTQVREGGSTKNIVLGVVFVSFSKSSILAPIQKARNFALGAALFIMLFSILVINLIARKMAHQIQLLSDGAREVRRGNLNVHITVSSKDELGQLAHEFNNMIQHFREKLHMQKFVSKLTVQMIRDTVRSEGKQSKAIIQEVAVFFSDVRNFSSVAEKLNPEEIVKLINIYFDLQTRIIEKHHGIVDKFMGDQIMAIFQGENMADNALRAAVDIQKQLRILNHERKAKGEVALEMGIGINNGSAIMGHMGSTHRMDYTVIGDVVNVAARLCSQAQAGQIITSLELARKVNGSYPTTRLKSISVKGRSKSVKVCEVDYNRDILM